MRWIPDKYFAIISFCVVLLLPFAKVTGQIQTSEKNEQWSRKHQVKVDVKYFLTDKNRTIEGNKLRYYEDLTKADYFDINSAAQFKGVRSEDLVLIARIHFTAFSNYTEVRLLKDAINLTTLKGTSCLTKKPFESVRIKEPERIDISFPLISGEEGLMEITIDYSVWRKMKRIGLFQRSKKLHLVIPDKNSQINDQQKCDDFWQEFDNAVSQKDQYATCNTYVENGWCTKDATRRKKRIAHQEFEKIRTSNDVLALRQYLTDFPDSKYESFVKGKIKELKNQPTLDPIVEERNWAEIRATDTQVAYRRYIEAHPQSKFRAMAERRLVEINTIDSLAWQQVQHQLVAAQTCKDSLRSYQTYLEHKKHHTQYLDEANTDIDFLERNCDLGIQITLNELQNGKAEFAISGGTPFEKKDTPYSIRAVILNTTKTQDYWIQNERNISETWLVTIDFLQSGNYMLEIADAETIKKSDTFNIEISEKSLQAFFEKDKLYIKGGQAPFGLVFGEEKEFMELGQDRVVDGLQERLLSQLNEAGHYTLQVFDRYENVSEMLTIEINQPQKAPSFSWLLWSLVVLLLLGGGYFLKRKVDAMA